MSDQKEFSFYFSSLAALAAVVASYRTIKTTLQMHKIKKEIKFVQNTQLYNAEEIVKEIKNHESRKKFKEIKNKQGAVVGLSARILLEGKVNSIGEPFVTRKDISYFKSDNIFSINKIEYKEQIFSNDSTDPKRGIYDVKLKNIFQKAFKESHRKQFALSQKQTQVIVSNYDKINYESALELLKYSETKRELSFHQHLLTLGLIALKFVVQLLFRNVDSQQFRGISVGTRDVEIGIKVGSIIGVIGQIIYNTETGALRIQKPQLIIKQRLSYLQNLKNQYNVLKDNRNILALVAAVTTLVAGRQLFKYLKRINKLPKWINQWVA